MSTELIGRTLKGYELIERIGAGGFGAVYRAEQNVVRREVAIKVILPQFANSPEFVRRFDAEAQFIARLEHPHIVPLFDYWRDPDGAYLVMRFVRGGSLGKRLKAHPLSLEEIARFLEQITAALSVAHRSGVVHLDLKPDNILMDDDGNAYLTDFGIAKTIGAENDQTSDGTISGTVSYAAPEQLQSRPPTPQSDVYSLGIILHEVLAGAHPFTGKNITAMIMAHIMEELPPLEKARPDLPIAFDAILRKATAKDPAARYQDVREMALVFRNALEEKETTITAEMLASLSRIENPYMGLRPFEEADAQNFFGREASVQRLTDHVRRASFLAVVGPSGSGKSSLVKAGLVPRLRQGAVTGSQEWFVVEMVPGSDPLYNLAAALNRIATRPTARLQDALADEVEALDRIAADLLADKDGDLLIIIDQFEEIFTQVESEAERLQFLELLRYAATRPETRLHIVITLRADFYDRPLQYEGFGSLIQQNTEVVLPLSTPELEAAIVGPLERIGIKADADLVATIIADVREEPGALPLLQYALTEVFERRDGSRLTLDAYTSSGGVSGALAKRAEEMFNDLNTPERRVTRQLFLRLVTLGEGEEDTRRRVRYGELITLGKRERVQDVLDRYGKYRLLTFDNDPDTREPLVEVAHEALIRSWQRLRDWLDESRNDVRLQRSLSTAADEWRRSQQDNSFLLRGARLAQFEEWMADTDLRLTEVEQTYLSASTAERERLAQVERERQAREQALEDRNRRRLQQLVAVLATAAVVAVALTFLAFNRSIAEGRARATSEFNAAEAGTQAAIAATAEQNAVAQRETSEFNAAEAGTQAAIAATAEQNAITEQQIAEQEASRAQSLALSSAAQISLLDGELDDAVALALEANRIPDPPSQSKLVLAQVAYNPGTLRRLPLDAPVDAVDISADGTHMATASRDGLIALWDTETGERLQVFEAHTDRVTSLDLSDDGQRLLTGSWDDTAILWEARTGTLLRTFEGHTDNVLGVSLSTSGVIVATASSDGTARIWNARTGEVRRTFTGHVGAVNAIKLSADSITLLTGGQDATLRLWSVQQGVELTRFDGHTESVNAVDYQPDGARYLSASDDGTIILHGANQFVTALTLRGHDDRVLDATYSADGSVIYSVSRDGSLIVWDAASTDLLREFDEHADDVLSVASSASNRVVVTGSQDETVRVWLVDAAAPQREVDVREGEAPAIAFSASGNRWLYGGLGRGVSLYAAAGAYNQQLRPVGGTFNDVTTVAFDTTSTLAAIGLQDRDAEVWQVASNELVRRYVGGHTGAVTDVAFTPDGDRLLTGSFDATVMLWDVQTGVQVWRFDSGHEDSVLAVAVNPDGTTAVSGSNDGSIVVWDLEQGRERLRMLGVRDGVADLVYNADGTLLYSAMDDGTIRQWDVTTGRELSRFVGHRGAVRSLAISADGETLLSGSDDRSMILWDVATNQIINRFATNDAIVTLALHPTEPLALSGAADGSVALWRVFSLSGVAGWVQGNRYVAPISCDQRVQYDLNLEGCL